MNSIQQCLTGLTSANEDIALLEFGNAVVQKGYMKNESVRIISGGSVFFGEFVGEGMLTAAIQGECFLAPPSKLILRTLRELHVNHIEGILLIVPGNTGDLLNFGLAAERALNEGIKVKVIAVNDNFDRKLPKICRSGLSGVVLVTKIAGSLSQKGKSLTDIYSFCEDVVANITSFEAMVQDGEKHKINKSADNLDFDFHLKIGDLFVDIFKKMKDEIYMESNITDEHQGIFRMKPGERIVVLLNNNGEISKLDEYIFLEELLKIMEHLGIIVERFFYGNFIKCAQKIMLTITILKVCNEEVLACLDEPCNAPGWKNVNQHSSIRLRSTLTSNLKRKVRPAAPIRGPKLTVRVANILLLSTQFACDALISCERQLNIIDSEVGNGDTGTRLKDTALVLLKRMKEEKLNTNCPYTFFESLSRVLEATVGGTIGCIYSILFEAAGYCFGCFCEDDEVTPLMWFKSLESASNALKKYGNIEFGDGTMYDPIFACVETIRKEFETNQNYIEVYGKGVAAAEEFAQKTKKNKERYPDPGAHAVGIWMRAVYESVKLRCPVE